MGKIKDYLLATLGTIGYVIWFVFAVAVCILPVLMFDLPWLIYTIISLLMLFILSKIPFVTEIAWCIGLIGAINGKQDVFAVIYYIMFAIIIGSFIFNLIVSFLPDK